MATTHVRLRVALQGTLTPSSRSPMKRYNDLLHVQFKMLFFDSVIVLLLIHRKQKENKKNGREPRRDLKTSDKE